MKMYKNHITKRFIIIIIIMRNSRKKYLKRFIASQPRLARYNDSIYTTAHGTVS